MLDIGFWELAVIGIVVLMVVRPEDLPAFMRRIGTYINQVRTMAGEFRSTIALADNPLESNDYAAGPIGAPSKPPPEQQTAAPPVPAPLEGEQTSGDMARQEREQSTAAAAAADAQGGGDSALHVPAPLGHSSAKPTDESAK